MTTETQERIEQESPEGSNTLWHGLGRVEANQRTMLQAIGEQGTKLEEHGFKMATLEANHQATLQRFDQQDARFDQQDARFDRQDAKLDLHGEKIDEQGSKLATLEVNQQTMLQRFDQQDARLDRQDAKLDLHGEKIDDLKLSVVAISAKQDSLEAKQDSLEDNQRLMMQMIQQQNERIDKLFYAVIGTGAVIIVTMLGIAFAS